MERLRREAELERLRIEAELERQRLEAELERLRQPTYDPYDYHRDNFSHYEPSFPTYDPY